MVDLREDYSPTSQIVYEAGKSSMLAKLDELGLQGKEKANEYIMASMQMFVKTIAAAYTSAKNREAVEDFAHLFMAATEQRIIAEIVNMQLKDH